MDEPLDTPRPRPFVWTTWLTPLVAGESHCWYALWYKAHHQYAKVAEAPEQQEKLTRWKSNHAAVVQDRVERLRAEGWAVTVEDQNKFYVRGDSATLSGCPDIIATMGQIGRVEDVKTGRYRDQHNWQVITYMLYAPLPRGVERPPMGMLVTPPPPMLESRALFNRHAAGVELHQAPYVVVQISHAAADAAARQRIGSAMRAAGAPTPPQATPSPGECGRCDILHCQYRQVGEVTEVVTEDF